MDQNNQTPTRKSCTPFKVYCLPAERAMIQQLADSAGMSVTRYLREVGLGYKIQGVLDSRAVRELVRVNGDLGRLGGLLKLWLAGDPRTAHFHVEHVHVLLNRIETTQMEMRAIMDAVIKRKSNR